MSGVCKGDAQFQPLRGMVEADFTGQCGRDWLESIGAGWNQPEMKLQARGNRIDAGKRLGLLCLGIVLPGCTEVMEKRVVRPSLIPGFPREREKGAREWNQK